MLEKILKVFGIDKDQFIAIVKISLKNDFRPAAESSSKRGKKLSGTLLPFIIYSWLGFFMAVTLLTKHASMQAYSFFMISYTMVMVFFAVLHEFDLILINPDDADVISFRPVNSVTYSAAKLLNFVIYVLLLTLSLSFMPVVIAFFLPGAGWIFPLLLFKVTGVASLSTGLIVVIFYTELLNRVPANKLKDGITYMQVLFTLMIFVVYQLVPRLGSDVLNSNAGTAGKWVILMPSAWYTGFIDFFTGRSSTYTGIYAFLAVLLTAVVFVFGIRKFSLTGAAKIAFLLQRIEKVSADKPKNSIFANPFIPMTLKLLKNNESKAGFFFASAMIKRDRSVRAGFLSLCAILIAAVIISLFDGSITDPFLHDSALHSGHFSYVFMFSIFVIFSLVSFIQFSSDYEGSWILKILPMDHAGEMYRGASRVIIVQILFPLYFVIFLVYAFKIGIVHAFLQVFVFYSFGALALTSGLFLIKSFPFSLKRVRGDKIRTFKMILFTLPVIIVYSILKEIIYANFFNLFIVISLLFLINFILEKIAVKRLNKILIDY